MIDYGKYNLLGVLIDAVDYEATVARIMAAAKAHQPYSVSAMAVHGVMTGVLDATHRYRLNRLDMIVPDGQPVIWGLNWLYNLRLPDRVYGPALTLKICEEAEREGLSVYLYGSRPIVLSALIERLSKQFPKLIFAGSQPSRFSRISAQEQQQIAETIRISGAAIVLIGLGCPRQEVWIYENREFLSLPCLAVGAAFDFHAGLLPQAPITLQSLGLEWVFRLYKEPGRLWKRYILLNPLYLALLLFQKLNIKRFELSTVSIPAKKQYYG